MTKTLTDTSGSNSWKAFTEALGAAGAIVDDHATPGDELTRAEGHRHLSRLISMGLETTLERADPAHPILANKLFSGGDTSDCRYLDAHIDGRYRYRISGHRGEAPLFEATVYSGKIGSHPQSAQLSFITEEELEVDPDGAFELFLSPNHASVNWLETPPETRYLMIRQYSHDWSKTRPANLRIEVLDEVDPPLPLEAPTLAEGLEGAARFVEGISKRWANIVNAIRKAPVNTLIPVPLTVGALSMPGGHRFATGHFELAPNEVLSIRFTPPDVPYWALQLTNYWFEPIDNGGTGAHLNNKTVRLEGDGRVELNISLADPKRSNWLSPMGHSHGTMQFRLSRGHKIELPDFETTVTTR
jgi:hypothetical protein